MLNIGSCMIDCGECAAYKATQAGDMEKLADMVVLGGDILSVPTMEIIDIPVDMTIIDGEVVFRR